VWREGDAAPITLKQRLRIGLLSLVANAGKTHACSRCGAKV
jgi:hypothetical protein